MIARRLTAEGPDDFVHQPLEIAVQSIRVLAVLPGKRRSPVRCSLRHQILGDEYSNNQHLSASLTYGDLNIRSKRSS